MEPLAKPGVAGIIEKSIDGCEYILIQERYKNDAASENGLLEIPAGKIREFESIFDCLRREVMEETGLEVTEIEGEKEAVVYKNNGYEVLSYVPFSSAQNISGSYPIMVQTFICKVKGEALQKSNESRNIKWMSLNELRELLLKDEKMFYPMHVTALKKYLSHKSAIHFEVWTEN
jgi:ADP-ribose pyrophosphatase